MIKKILALAVTALLSSAATAGYVRYDFTGPAHGFIIQRDDDLSIANYAISFPVGWDKKNPAANMGIHPITGYGYTYFNDTFTQFRTNGPTGFSAYTNNDDMMKLNFEIQFSKAPYGRFAYTIDYAGTTYLIDGTEVFNGESNPYMKWFRGEVKGQVTTRPLTADETYWMDVNEVYGDNVGKSIPRYIGRSNEVPEPTNIALLGIAALGAACAIRRRKSV